jgi:hypothetical protein
MTDTIDAQQAPSSRLKLINLELGRLATEHRACRLHSFGFSAAGAVLLVVSILGLISLLVAGKGDWTRNPDSPVYAIAAEREEVSVLRRALIAGGFVAGFGCLFWARSQCARQRRLWRHEKSLRDEMRGLRDELYAAGGAQVVQVAQGHRPPGPTTPLDPDAARDAYVGIYNPPPRHRDPD